MVKDFNDNYNLIGSTRKTEYNQIQSSYRGQMRFLLRVKEALKATAENPAEQNNDT